MLTMASTAYLTCAFADDTPDTTNFSINCNTTQITLGMSADAVKQACGKPSDSYERSRNGAQYLKLKYKSTDSNDESQLELKFSDMQSKGQLKLYEIELDQEHEHYNPYKQ